MANLTGVAKKTEGECRRWMIAASFPGFPFRIQQLFQSSAPSSIYHLAIAVPEHCEEVL
jgi:hypothetical protein